MPFKLEVRFFISRDHTLMWFPTKIRLLKIARGKSRDASTAFYAVCEKADTVSDLENLHLQSQAMFP